jgi:hypothetical protein
MLMMSRFFVNLAIGFVVLVLLRGTVVAGPIPLANCNTSVCSVPENILGLLPFTAIAGDVILTEPGGVIVSDVFRIFNNLVDTGGGTGLGNTVLLYSSDDTILPDLSTYSVNAVFIQESPSGITSFVGNGTTYLLGVPEPQAAGLVGVGLAMLVLVGSRQRVSRMLLRRPPRVG